MRRYISIIVAMVLVVSSLIACSTKKDDLKLGVSFGVGPAARWSLEQGFMEEHAKARGVGIELRMNRGDTDKTQQEDCIELIDSGIDVLIITPRDVNNVSEILEYAEKKNVPVISYARVVKDDRIDLFVGYDSERIGQKMGQFVSEMVYKGDYIILKGDEGDFNTKLLYDGMMHYVDLLKGDVSILLDAYVPNWSPEEAKKMVLEAIRANDNKVDAILAPNDKIAGACAQAVAELGIEDHVVITGMDAELDAVQRIANGTQAMSVYMDLKELATLAIDEAYHIANGEKVNVNVEFDNESELGVKANLISGQIITKDNLDRVLIDGGHFTREEIYGTGK